MASCDIHADYVRVVSAHLRRPRNLSSDRENRLRAARVTPGEFATKWRGVVTSERASSQSHFIDLCQMLGEPTPNEVRVQ